MTDGSNHPHHELSEEERFECEVCGEFYDVKSDHELDSITVDCRYCGAISSRCYPV